MELDRQRPYGIIHGIENHKYVQDGLKFDVHGICIDDVPEKEGFGDGSIPMNQNRAQENIEQKEKEGFLCSFCGFLAKTKRGLDIHKKAKHGET